MPNICEICQYSTFSNTCQSKTRPRNSVIKYATRKKPKSILRWRTRKFQGDIKVTVGQKFTVITEMPHLQNITRIVNGFIFVGM